MLALWKSRGDIRKDRQTTILADINPCRHTGVLRQRIKSNFRRACESTANRTLAEKADVE